MTYEEITKRLPREFKLENSDIGDIERIPISGTAAEILKLLSEFSSQVCQREISRKLDKSPSCVSKSLTRLLQKGLIRYDSPKRPKTYLLTEKGNHMVSRILTESHEGNFKYSVRGHGFVFSFKIVKEPRQWPVGTWTSWTMHNWIKYKLKISDNVSILRTPRHIEIYVHEVYSRTVSEAKYRALLIAFQYVDYLEKTNLGLRLGDPKETGRLKEQSYALNQYSYWAERLLDGGYGVLFFDPVDGKPRLKVDRSKNNAELEACHGLYADEDASLLNEFAVSVLNGDFDYKKTNEGLLQTDKNREYIKQLRGDIDNMQKSFYKDFGHLFMGQRGLMEQILDLNRKVFDYIIQEKQSRLSSRVRRLCSKISSYCTKW